MRKFDAIIIGSGQGGTPLAKKLAKAGFETLIVEKRYVGGTCINDGCTPTKAMIASAEMAHAIRRSKELGIHTGVFSVNLKEIVERKNKIVTMFRSSAENGLDETQGLTLLFGEAFFSGKKTITVSLADGGQEEFESELIFINTGATPNIPKINGVEQVHYHTSTTLLDLAEIPPHLVIIGGGYIALEYAQMFRRFGSEVSMVVRGKTFLPNEDEDISSAIQAFFKEEGIKIYMDATTGNAANTGADEITLTITTQGINQLISGSHLLIATGRTPQTAALKLDQTGVETDSKGFISVDEYLETKVPGIYAIGDVKGGPAFTHISYNDHLVILKNIVHKMKVSIKDRPVPYTMFTDPQLGRIGLTEKEARQQGLHIKVATLSMDKVARGIETGETTGLMKAIVDADTKKILGAAILAAEGGEVMSILQMAMMGGITYDMIRETIFAHPLYAESLNNLFMTLEK